jgi:hypothetical protein
MKNKDQLSQDLENVSKKLQETKTNIKNITKIDEDFDRKLNKYQKTTEAVISDMNKEPLLRRTDQYYSKILTAEFVLLGCGLVASSAVFYYFKRNIKLW